MRKPARAALAFKTNDRGGVTAAPMQAEVAEFNIPDMIPVAAYAAAE
jgi:hypothetical protein